MIRAGRFTVKSGLWGSRFTVTRFSRLEHPPHRSRVFGGTVRATVCFVASGVALLGAVLVRGHDPVGVDPVAESPAVHLPLGDGHGLDPAELDEPGPGVGRPAPANPEVLGDPGERVPPIRAVVPSPTAVVLVPEEPADEQRVDERRHVLGKPRRQGPQHPPWDGHAAPGVGDLGEHRPESRHVVDADLVGRTRERDPVLGDGDEPEPRKRLQVGPQLADRSVVPPAPDEPNDLGHRVERPGVVVIGLEVPAALHELVGGEVEPILPPGHMSRTVQPPGQHQLVGGDMAEASLDAVGAFADSVGPPHRSLAVPHLCGGRWTCHRGLLSAYGHSDPASRSFLT